MKRVAAIQDLSCLGKCSLTVALPVLSAMGIACSVLPTAVLSTHTAFPEPHCRGLTEDILPAAKHWLSVGAEFDSICVGYLSDPDQAQQVLQAIGLFDAPVILDPAMGDNGKLYARITQAHVEAMKQLCSRADYLLPNVTEAAFLTEEPYRDRLDITYLRVLAAKLLAFGAKGVVITGFCWEDGQTGFFAVSASGEETVYRAPKIGKHFHGTGDLFAAVFTGALVNGRTMAQAARLAAGFVERVIQNTPEATRYGVNFEPELPWLWQQL